MTVNVVQGSPRAITVRGRPFDSASVGVVPLILLWQAIGLGLQLIAVMMARQTQNPLAYYLSCGGYAVTFGSALWFQLRPNLTRAVRNTTVICLGLTSAIQWRLGDPVVYSSFDEQLHLRTLRDILASHNLFQPNPLLTVSPRYPGLESLTALLHQIGVPVGAATFAVVLIARSILVLVLCNSVEQMTGSVRAGGIAVSVYATSAQFVWFNSQYAYQTLALPLALTAIALVARARTSASPHVLLGGAGICLVAVTATHHVTSLLAAAFLCAWSIAEPRGPGRRRVWCAAAIAVAATTVWAIVQWSLLQGYFGPIVDDMSSQVRNGFHRAAFTDGSGTVTPLWQRLLMIYYAAVVSAFSAWLVLSAMRAAVRRRRRDVSLEIGSAHWQPQLLLVIPTALIPVLFAARVFPSGAEICDRSSGFIFLPFSALVASGVVRWMQSRQGRHSKPLSERKAVALRVLVVVLASGVFSGGYLAGSGPDWGRLPGPYLVSSNRSMDPETLAAVRWVGNELPAGSRIGADFVSSLLLASQADVWPLKHDLPDIYFADQWGPDQTELARHLRVRYVYVDRRLADELPHVGWYFDKGETPGPQKLTVGQLTKFDSLQGVELVYRHGPISIYDLSGLGIPTERTGWIGTSDMPSAPVQFAIGLLVGLAILFFRRTQLGIYSARQVSSFRAVAGAPLTFATLVAATCVLAVWMLLAHIWIGPATFAAAAIVVLLGSPQSVTKFAAAVRRNRKWIGLSALILPLVGATIAQATLDAASADIHKVDAILTDPSAIHVSQHLPTHAPAENCHLPTILECHEAG